jgi:hypothetical protein
MMNSRPAFGRAEMPELMSASIVPRRAAKQSKHTLNTTNSTPCSYGKHHDTRPKPTLTLHTTCFAPSPHTPGATDLEITISFLSPTSKLFLPRH